MKSLSSIFSTVFFVLGLVLLSFLVAKVGVLQILQTLKELGSVKILILTVFPLSWYLLQSFAWYRVFKDDAVAVRFMDVFLVKLTGEAINTITPVGFMGGDPYRIYLLKKTVGGKNSAASVVVDRSMQTFAILCLLMLTIILALCTLPLTRELKLGLPILGFGFIVFLFMMIRSHKKGVFAQLAGFAHALHIKRESLAKVQHKIDELDEQISRFYKKHPLHFFEIFTLHFLSRLLGPVEIWIMAWIMGFPLDALTCLYLAALTILINIVFVFIPGSIGVMEGGYGYLFHLLKLVPAHGVTLQLVRRIRALFYVLVGLVIILIYHPQARSQDPL